MALEPTVALVKGEDLNADVDMTSQTGDDTPSTPKRSVKKGKDKKKKASSSKSDRGSRSQSLSEQVI